MSGRRGRPPHDYLARPSTKRSGAPGGAASMAALREAVAAERAARAADAVASTSNLDPASASLLRRNARPAAVRPQSKWVRTDPVSVGVNQGVGRRAAADAVEQGVPPPPRGAATNAPSAAALARSEAALARKAALYDALVAGEVLPEGAATAGGCVDFGARAAEERGRAAARVADAAAAADAFLAGGLPQQPQSLPPPPPLPP